MSVTAEQYYMRLRNGSAAEYIARWDQEIEAAESERLLDPRGKAMDILLARPLDATRDNGSDVEDSHLSPEEEWIQLGLDIEVRQLALLSKVRSLGRRARDDERKAADTDRERLREQLALFFAMQDRLNIRGGPLSVSNDAAYVVAFEDAADERDAEGGPDPVPSATPTVQSPTVPGDILTLPAESIPLPLPSVLMDNTSPLKAIELSLRQRQADKCLEDLREAIAEKSFLYSHVVRVAPRKAVRTRSRTTIMKIDRTIASLSAAYCKCRAAFERLEAPSSIREKYKVLERADTLGSTAILDPNTPGTSQQQLSWIWQMGELSQTPGATPSTTIHECRYLRCRQCATSLIGCY